MSDFSIKRTRRTLTALAVGGIAALSARVAVAQEFPNQPVTLVVGFPPGGSTDVVARILA